MAPKRAKKGSAKAKTRKVRTSRAPARKARTGGGAKAKGAAPATQRRIAQLEAENRRLREEISSLRARLVERPESTALGEPAERTPALEL